MVESFWKRLWTCRLTDYWWRWWWYIYIFMRGYIYIYPLIIFLSLLQQMLIRGSPLVRASNSWDLSLILRHNTCTYRTKNVNNLGSFLSIRGFFVSLTSLTHTNYLSILSRVFLLLKNDRISEQIQAQSKYAHTRRNIGKKKKKRLFICPVAQSSVM